MGGTIGHVAQAWQDQSIEYVNHDTSCSLFEIVDRKVGTPLPASPAAVPWQVGLILV